MAKTGSKSRKAITIDASMRVVVLKGPEHFLRIRYTQDLRQALEQAHGGVEQFEFDGRSVALSTVLDELRSYGLMQQHKLVIVDHADAFLSAGSGNGSDDDGDGEGDSDADASSSAGSRSAIRPAMEKYAENPVPDATLLLRAETWRPGRLDKAIVKAGGAVLDCKQVSDSDAILWCGQRCRKRYDAEIDRAASIMLVDRLGPRLERLDQELNKLATFVGKGGKITEQTIMEMTGLSREEAGWIIQDAVLSGDPGFALTKLGELLDVSQVPYEVLSWSLIDVMRKCHAASQMLRQGMPEGVISKELKLWGRAQATVLSIARHCEPATLAALFEQTVRSDAGVKTGMGDSRRSLEASTMLLADTMKSRSR